MNNLWRRAIIFVGILCLGWYYNYDDLLGKSPQSLHHWRQSDCASLCEIYHEKGQPFWQPEIHALVSDYGTTGKNAPSEIAVYYWGIGQLYHLVGNEASLLRIINTLLFLSGIAAFIWCLFVISKSFWWSLFVGLLLFTSPILVYYGNNFLTNAPALGMALWALMFFTLFIKRKEKKYWWLATAFFFLAGALKLPGLFLFFAIGAVVVLHPRSLPSLKLKDYLISAVVILLPILAWVLYARYYNQLHHTVYFSTTIFPVWEYSWQEVKDMASGMLEIWWGEHFHPAVSVVFIALALVLPFFKTGISKPWRLLLVYLIAELAAFLLLQYFTFVFHDYYTINMFMLAALLLVLLSHWMKNRFPKLLTSWATAGILLVILLGNVYYANERLEFRYTEYPNEIRNEAAFLYEGAGDWLSGIGVAETDTIIFIEDASNTSLYLLNRYGWTTHRHAFKDTSQTIVFNRSKEGIRRSIANGAEYLVVNGQERLYEKEYLRPFLKHLTGQRRGLYVFNLKDTTRNFRLPEKRLLRQITFNFEDSLETFVPVEKTQESPEALSGSRVAVALPGDEYLGYHRVDSLQSGMMLEVLVWIKKSADAKALPIIAGEAGTEAFVQETKVVNEQNGWQQYKQELLISEPSQEGSYKVFMWNPSGTEVLFDDLQISVYERR